VYRGELDRAEGYLEFFAEAAESKEVQERAAFAVGKAAVLRASGLARGGGDARSSESVTGRPFGPPRCAMQPQLASGRKVFRSGSVGVFSLTSLKL